MKRSEASMRMAVVAALMLASSLFAAVAQADPTPSPSPSVSADPYKAAMEQFKRDRDIFMSAMRERENKIRDINMIFKSAVDKANLDARNALATATTPLQKTTITATRRTAIDAAINARDTAIAALGDAPAPPTEPMRPARPMMSNEPKGKQKR